MFGKKNLEQQLFELVNMQHQQLMATHTKQHEELVTVLREQTRAIAELAESNKELVVSLAQLIVSDVQEVGSDDVPADPHESMGMGDARGGYVQRDNDRTAQQWER